MAEKNLFELLRDKSILAILDGDEDFGGSMLKFRTG